ncbi:MAG: glycosyltransferase family 4 protein [Acidobacteria bacterium]|nr:glycosyltransferase family 4 protein [Acidobacteriota bacterium]
MSDPLPPFFRLRPIGLALRAAALPLFKGENAIVPLTKGDGREAAGGRSHILSPTGFRIGFLGRIEPRKGQLDLARAFHRFHRRYTESRLEFVGPAADKKYRDEIRRFVKKEGLNDAVKLRGRVADPFPKLKSWNLFVSLSSDEGQGIAILEAMALGVPVLGRRVAGVEDYLRDRQTGIAVGSSSPSEVAERMEWALHHENELAQIASRAKRMVETDYTWDSTLEKMNSLYETVTRTNQRLD